MPAGPRFVGRERELTLLGEGLTEAIAKLGERDPLLSRHLENTVRTGAFCSYRPEEPTRVTWLS